MYRSKHFTSRGEALSAMQDIANERGVIYGEIRTDRTGGMFELIDGKDTFRFTYKTIQ